MIDFNGFFVDDANVFYVCCFIVGLIFLRTLYIAPRWKFLRDKRRSFTSAQRKRALTLSGNRCEHVNFLFKRCSSTGPFQMDHHYPHSRGGKTCDRNLVVLCTYHNQKKSGHWPNIFYTLRITIKRFFYYPKNTKKRPSCLQK